VGLHVGVGVQERKATEGTEFTQATASFMASKTATLNPYKIIIKGQGTVYRLFGCSKHGNQGRRRSPKVLAAPAMSMRP